MRTTITVIAIGLFILAVVASAIVGGGDIRPVRAPASAEHWIYQLPEDGAWARYEKTPLNDPESKTPFTIRSVGTATAGAKKCRWLECEWRYPAEKISPPTGRRTVVISKFLVPEAALSTGIDPASRVVRAWESAFPEGRVNSDGSLPYRRLRKSTLRLRALNAFPYPASAIEGLPAKSMETPLGKLNCDGLSGEREFAGSSKTIVYSIETRRHRKAPFGLVAATVRWREKGNEEEKGGSTWKLMATGTGAKSKLPACR